MNQISYSRRIRFGSFLTKPRFFGTKRGVSRQWSEIWFVFNPMWFNSEDSPKKNHISCSKWTRLNSENSAEKNQTWFTLNPKQLVLNKEAGYAKNELNPRLFGIKHGYFVIFIRVHHSHMTAKWRSSSLDRYNLHCVTKEVIGFLSKERSQLHVARCK